MEMPVQPSSDARATAMAIAYAMVKNYTPAEGQTGKDAALEKAKIVYELAQIVQQGDGSGVDVTVG